MSTSDIVPAHRTTSTTLTDGGLPRRNGLVSNAIWNVVNGGSTAIVSLAVPPFLTRTLSPEAFGAWAIALQIGAYVALFGFGLQVAVGRYVAHAEARDDIKKRDGIVATAFWFLALASLAGWLAICTFAYFVDRMIPDLSGGLIHETRTAIVMVGLALAANLPTSIFAAVFTGQQRSDIPAKIQGVGRICLALGLIGAGYWHDLAILGIVYAIISVSTSIALWLAWRTGTRAPSVAPQNMNAGHARELASFCFSLTVWNFAMILVNGLDLLIVGRWDHAMTPYFAASATFVAMISGLLSSLTMALVPVTASFPSDQIARKADALLRQSTAYISCVATIATLALLYFGHPIMSLWLGDAYADRSMTILSALALGTYIRTLLLPYTSILVALGLQNRILFIPLIEGLMILILSLLLVPGYGAFGVAITKPLSAAVMLLLLLVRHPMQSVTPALTRLHLISHSLLIGPAILTAAVALKFVILAHAGPWDERLSVIAFCLASVLIMFLTFAGKASRWRA